MVFTGGGKSGSSGSKLVLYRFIDNKINMLLATEKIHRVHLEFKRCASLQPLGGNMARVAPL